MNPLGFEGLIHKIARRWRDRAKLFGADLDDLLQIGRIAIVKASQRFDPSRGKELPYAFRAVNNEFRQLFMREIRTIVVEDPGYAVAYDNPEELYRSAEMMQALAGFLPELNAQEAKIVRRTIAGDPHRIGKGFPTSVDVLQIRDRAVEKLRRRFAA